MDGLEAEFGALLGLAFDHLVITLAPRTLAQLHRVVAAVLACNNDRYSTVYELRNNIECAKTLVNEYEMG